MHVIRKYFLFFAVCYLYVRMLNNCHTVVPLKVNKIESGYLTPDYSECVRIMWYTFKQD